MGVVAQLVSQFVKEVEPSLLFIPLRPQVIRTLQLVAQAGEKEDDTSMDMGLRPSTKLLKSADEHAADLNSAIAARAI
jgi:hypothetical protein